MKESMKELIDDAQEEDFPTAGTEELGNEEEDDFDEGGREWEAAQIKRGEGRRVMLSDEGTGKKVYRAKPSAYISPSFLRISTDSRCAVPETTTLPTLSTLKARLASTLSGITENHSISSTNLAHFATEKSELSAQEEELRGEVERMYKKSRWFNDFGVIVEELGAFLGEKVRHSSQRVKKILSEMVTVSGIGTNRISTD